MKITVLLTLLFATVGTCPGQQVLAEYDWSKLAQTGGPLKGELSVVGGRTALRVANTNDTPLQAQILKIAKPAITKTLYAIEGEVKCERVRGAGYLEMWNYYPPVNAGGPEAGYFSRTLAESGEMGKLTGSSDWRHFRLPFDHTGVSSAPLRLEVNVVLPGQGTVYLGSLKLVEYKGSLVANQAGAADAWWADRAGGLIGGITGGVLGCLGSLLAWLAAKGKARGFVLASLKLLIGLGAASIAVGLLAMTLRQPFSVWSVPLLIGVIVLGILPFRLKQYERDYQELELRRMTAVDA